MCVRKPASRSRSSRSSPTAPPRTASITSRSRVSSQLSDGTLRSSIERRLLRLVNRGDPGIGEIEHCVEVVAAERRALRGRLYLHQQPCAGPDDVHVDLCGRVLLVVEVEQALAADHPDRHRRDGVRQRARETRVPERAGRRDVCARDRRAARAAVGLEHVAVHPERSLAERLQVGDGAQGAADQALDLDGAPLLLACARLALRALAGRGRQERVLGGEPAAARASQPARNLLVERCRAQHASLPLRVEHRAERLLEVVDDELERTQLIWPPPVLPAHAGAASRSATATCSTSPSGSCRKRSPRARKSAGSPVVRNRYEPSRPSPFSMPLRASVSATSRAVSSAEKTSVTPRPKTRWKTGRISG